MTRLSATTGISNRGAQLATLNRRQRLPKAVFDFTMKADIGAIGRTRPIAVIAVGRTRPQEFAPYRTWRLWAKFDLSLPDDVFGSGRSRNSLSDQLR